MGDLIKPDYSSLDNEHPREDDDLFEEIDEDEARLEAILDEKLQEGREEEKMSNTPFSQSSWLPSSTPQAKPWEQNNNHSGNSPSWNNWGSNGGNNGSGWKAPSWSGSSQPTTPQAQAQQQVDVRTLRHRAVAIDFLDCLFEPWDANGAPNKLPRAIFDLKPKFEVWEKLQVLSPTKLYIIFPPEETIPTFGDREASYVIQKWVQHCLSAYTRIPNDDVLIIVPMNPGAPREKVLEAIKNNWTNGIGPNTGRVDEIISIGTHSGIYDLGTRDFDAAKNCGIHFMNVYNLMQGRYIIE